MALSCNYLLYDILKFFSRYELMCSSEVSRRWRDIIEQKFSEAPYFIVDNLSYDSSCSKWLGSWKNTEFVSNDVNFVAKAKYMRARQTTLKFSSHPMTILASIGHIWKNMLLEISCEKVNHSVELFQLILTCKTLVFSCRGSVLAFQNFIPDTLTEIRLDDPNDSPVIDSLPIDGIVNYLFSNDLTKEVKRLTINRHVTNPWNDQQCQHMVEKIKKRFLQEVTPVCLFHLVFQTTENFHSMVNGFDLHNDRTNQRLTLRNVKIDPNYTNFFVSLYVCTYSRNSFSMSLLYAEK